MPPTTASHVRTYKCYFGSLDMSDGFPRKIPLALALRLTNKGEKPVEAGVWQYLWRGSFIVDGDGGPYVFSTVEFDINACLFSLWYASDSRRGFPNAYDFALELYLKEDMSLSGEVYSNWGQIGTALLHGEANRASLPERQGYEGTWRGEAETTDSKKEILTVRMINALDAYTNPPTAEFGFTPGKSVCFKWAEGGSVVSSEVTIDYLRRRVTCIARNPDRMCDWVASFSITPDSETIKGSIDSATTGRVLTFTLPLVHGT